MERDKKLQEYMEKRAKERAERRSNQGERRRFREEPPTKYKNRQGKFRNRSRSLDDRERNDRGKREREKESDHDKNDKKNKKENTDHSVDEKSIRRFTESCEEKNNEKENLKESSLNTKTVSEITAYSNHRELEKVENSEEVANDTVEECLPNSAADIDQTCQVPTEENNKSSAEETKEEQSISNALEIQQNSVSVEKEINSESYDALETKKETFLDGIDEANLKNADEDIWASLEEGIGRYGVSDNLEPKNAADVLKFIEKRKAHTKKLLEQFKEKRRLSEEVDVSFVDQGSKNLEKEISKPDGSEMPLEATEKLEEKRNEKSTDSQRKGEYNSRFDVKKTDRIEEASKTDEKQEKNEKSGGKESEKSQKSFRENSPREYKKRSKRRQRSRTDSDSDRSSSRKRNRSRSRSRNPDRRRKYDSHSRRRR